MTKYSWKLFRIITVIISLVTLIFNWRYTTGYLLGTLEAFIQYRRIETFWTGVLSSGVSHKNTGYGNFAFNFLMMAGTLFLCILFQDYLNIIACAVGMLMIKITTLIEVLIHRKEEDA